MWGYIMEEPGTPASARGSRCPGSSEKATTSSGVALLTVGACPALAPGHSPTLTALATMPAVERNCRRLRRAWVASTVAYPWALAVPVCLPHVITYPPPTPAVWRPRVASTCHIYCYVCKVYASTLRSPSATFSALKNKGFVRCYNCSERGMHSMVSTSSLPHEAYGNNCVSRVAGHWCPLLTLCAGAGRGHHEYRHPRC
jgi:hypothetical protein